MVTRAPFDSRPMIEDVLASMRELLDETHASVEVSAGELPVIHGDRDLLGIVVQNLVANAVKFRKPDQVPRVAIACEASGNELHLTVSDEGIGFEPRYADEIFDHFRRLHPRDRYPGSGLGLALCKELVEAHGGRIGALGRPGAGATFTVVLPTTSAGAAM